MTLTFDLLTPNTEAFILVPKCNKAESLVKICLIFSTYCVNSVQGGCTDRHADAQTDALTAQIHNASGQYAGRGINITGSQLMDEI